MTDADKQNTVPGIEINSQLLAKVLNHKTVAAADIRCLGSASKKQVWRLCLQVCTDHNV